MEKKNSQLVNIHINFFKVYFLFYRHLFTKKQNIYYIIALFTFFKKLKTYYLRVVLHCFSYSFTQYAKFFFNKNSLIFSNFLFKYKYLNKQLYKNFLKNIFINQQDNYLYKYIEERDSINLLNFSKFKNFLGNKILFNRFFKVKSFFFIKLLLLIQYKVYRGGI